MTTFDFDWTTGKTRGSFKVDANSQEVAVKIAVLMAQDRSGKMILSSDNVQIVKTTDWI